MKTPLRSVLGPHLRRHLVGAVVLAIAGIVYFQSLPTTVQGLDTGEVVASAYRLNIAHPPGFPLYLWLQHFFTHAFAVQTVFWRAAFLTLLLSLGTLALLGLSARSLWYWIGCVLPLAFMGSYWRYSVLPDVFMLNLLFVSAIGWVYLRSPSSPRKLGFLFSLFWLGALNHPTIVFVAPLLVAAVVEERSWRKGAAFALLGFAGFAAGYSSLLLMNTGSLYSWGKIQGVGDLLWHFLRRDYGTFQLSGKVEETNAFQLILDWMRALLQGNPLAVVLATFPIFVRRRPSRRYWVLLATLMLYLGFFFPRANASSPEVLERFHLLPLVLVMILAGVGAEMMTQRLRRPLLVLLGVSGLALGILNFQIHRAENDYSWNTVVEDYGRNFLAMSNEDRRTVFIMEGDTRCFGLRYLQQVEGVHPDALVLCLGAAFDRHLMRKVQAQWPDFHYSPTWNEGGEARGVLRHIVAPNIEKYQFIFSRNVNSEEFRTTFLGIGRRISRGSGIDLEPASLDRLVRRSDLSRVIASTGSAEIKALYAEYAFYFLKAGLLDKDPSRARGNFEKALEVVPYCVPALQNICSLRRLAHEDTQDCERKLAGMLPEEARYW